MTAPKDIFRGFFKRTAAFVILGIMLWLGFGWRCNVQHFEITTRLLNRLFMQKISRQMDVYTNLCQAVL